MFTGAAVRRLRCSQIPPQTVDLREFVEGRTGRMFERVRLRVRPGTGPLGFCQRLGPVATEAQDLRTVHQALAPEGNQVGLRRAPATEGGRPFTCPPKVEQRMAGIDDGAVDDTHGDGRDVVDRHPDHDLIEQRRGFPGLTPTCVHHREHETAEDRQLRIVELCAERDGTIGCLCGCADIALLEELSRRERREQSQRGGILSAFEDVESTCQPAVPARPFTAIEKIEDDPEDAARSSWQVLAAQALAVGAGPEFLTRFFRAAEICRDGLTLEIVRHGIGEEGMGNRE